MASKSFSSYLWLLSALALPSLQLSVDASCRSFDFGSGPTDVTNLVTSATVEAGNIAIAAAAAANQNFNDFDDNDDENIGLFVQLFNGAQSSVSNLQQIYGSLSNLVNAPSSVQVTIFCGDDHIIEVDAIVDGQQTTAFVDTSKLSTNNPSGQSQVASVEEVAVVNYQRCSDIDEAYSMQGSNTIILCPNAFTVNLGKTINDLGLEKNDGAVLDDFHSLTGIIFHEMQHTNILSSPLDDQTLSKNELQQVFGDDLGALGAFEDLSQGDVICYRTPLCQVLAKLHPDRAPNNPDSVTLLATGIFLLQGANGGWDFSNLEEGGQKA